MISTRPVVLTTTLVLSLLLCHCDDGSAARINSLREEIDQMNQQSFDASQQVKRWQSQIEAAKGEKQHLEAEKAEAEKEAAETKQKLDQLQRDFDTYKSTYKLSMQKRAPGMKLEDFTSVEGKAFRNIVLRELTDTYVNFTHEGGIIKLATVQLPEHVQALLGLLNKRFDEPRNVKAATPRQTYRLRQAEHSKQVEDIEEAIRSLRRQKEQSLWQSDELGSQIRVLVNTGRAGSNHLKRLKDQTDLEVQRTSNQILQMEVDLLHLRRNYPREENRR